MHSFSTIDFSKEGLKSSYPYKQILFKLMNSACEFVRYRKMNDDDWY